MSLSPEVIMAGRVRRQAVQGAFQQPRRIIKRGQNKLALLPVFDVSGRLLVHVVHLNFQLESREVGKGQWVEGIAEGGGVELHDQLRTAADDFRDYFTAAEVGQGWSVRVPTVQDLYVVLHHVTLIPDPVEGIRKNRSM